MSLSVVRVLSRAKQLPLVLGSASSLSSSSRWLKSSKLGAAESNLHSQECPSPPPPPPPTTTTTTTLAAPPNPGQRGVGSAGLWAQRRGLHLLTHAPQSLFGSLNATLERLFLGQHQGFRSHLHTRGALHAFIDYYAVLGVSDDACQKEIKKAYYRKSMLHHPDKNHGDETAAKKFALLTEAYTTLSQPDLRQVYDAERPRGMSSKAGAKSSGSPHFKHGDFQGKRRQGPLDYSNAAFDFQAHFKAHYGDVEVRKRARLQALKMQEQLQQMNDNGSTWFLVGICGIFCYLFISGGKF